jgi:hypothetical protein
VLGPVAQRLEQGTHNPLVPGSNPGGPIQFPISEFGIRILYARVRARILFLLELVIVISLVTITRCADYSDVFAGHEINFVDADCFARMTRARICFEHPGTIVRRHHFENFPIGTSPHTTVPLDYLIVGTAAALRPFTSDALELAGAIVSPLLAIGLGIFLCWWTRRMRLRFSWALLLLYALSPILAHGFALGRPDHQSLVLALVAVALCGEWVLARESSSNWSFLTGVSWALAIWVSPYEPLVLFTLVVLLQARTVLARYRRIGWIAFAIIIAIALTIERRIPWPPSVEIMTGLKNWSGTIGELVHVPWASAVWFEWCGGLLLLAPILFWRMRENPRWFMIALLIATFLLTMWQARWSYFFALLFAFIAPQILGALRNPVVAFISFAIALFPIAQAWDRTFSDEERARHSENKIELIELHDLAQTVDGPFIAPWWFSPALTYWSRQPAVAGSSHESISGIVDSAKLFAAEDSEVARSICDRRGAKWVVSYDSERLAQNAAAILGTMIPSGALVYVLGRNPSNAPPFLHLSSQTGRFKSYRVSSF